VERLGSLARTIPVRVSPGLSQGKMDVVKETLNVAGLLTHVYSRSDLRDTGKPPHSSEPVVVLFFLHGRLQSADTVDATARAAFAWAAERQAKGSGSSKQQSPRDFVVVTFVRGLAARVGLGHRRIALITVVDAQDQRNHGKRTVDERGNLGWSRKEEYHNDRHARVSTA
jgi:hypothetical protein